MNRPSCVPARYNRPSMAQTPWGNLTVDDAHVHFFSHAFYATLSRQKNLSGPEQLEPLLEWQIPGPDPAALAAHWVAELDRVGVNRVSLIASMPGDEASVSAAVAAYPNRFFGYFMFDPTQPDSVARMKAAGTNPRLHGICLFPAMHAYSITDGRVLPLIEIAAADRLAVFVHCGAISVGVRKKLGLPSHFDMRFSNPLDLHAIASRFPQTPFVIPHFGAGMLREALMLADLCPNVYLDTSSSNHWMAYEGLDLRAVYRRALDVAGPERLLFGTDSSFFPRGWQSDILEKQTTALYELGLKQAQAEQILYLNLERMLAPRAAFKTAFG